MRIGERIKQRRLELGYTADALAKMLNKNRATIYRYENGKIENMPIDILEPLAKALSTTPAYLMGWQESHQESTSTRPNQTENYYLDIESRGISKEEIQEAVNYIEFIKSKNKN